MALFSWTPALATGNALMDAEHHVLVKRVDAVLDAISQQRSNEIVIGAVQDLLAYTREHFAREEVQMQRIGYVGIREHIAEHARLISQVEALTFQLEARDGIDVMGHYSFLTRWVKDHIMLVDTEFAVALNASLRPSGSTE
jgi:hemerythrin-like metal-binding protein